MYLHVVLVLIALVLIRKEKSWMIFLWSSVPLYIVSSCWMSSAGQVQRVSVVREMKDNIIKQLFLLICT